MLMSWPTRSTATSGTASGVGFVDRITLPVRLASVTLPSAAEKLTLATSISWFTVVMVMSPLSATTSVLAVNDTPDTAAMLMSWPAWMTRGVSIRKQRAVAPVPVLTAAAPAPAPAPGAAAALATIVTCTSWPGCSDTIWPGSITWMPSIAPFLPITARRTGGTSAGCRTFPSASSTGCSLRLGNVNVVFASYHRPFVKICTDETP